MAKKSKTCTHHCRGCNRHFGGLTAFDAHRTGPYSNRACEDPPASTWHETEGRCEISPSTWDVSQVAAIWASKVEYPTEGVAYR